MYLRFYLDENKKRVYTLKFQAPDGSATFSAHPAKFSPCDPNSDERIKCKKRFDLLLTQSKPVKL
ncbi:unnamed protein product [Moneuplotes crassus]|uniref:Nucleolar protein 10 n=1 Tax=Euplotes crassus TaxID=5936 RepID=A0AAD1Y728_EUPCR|nr:unnamed protein product [Moneuplotes crassus]